MNVCVCVCLCVWGGGVFYEYGKLFLAHALHGSNRIRFVSNRYATVLPDASSQSCLISGKPTKIGERHIAIFISYSYGTNQIKSNIFIGFKIQKQDCYQLHTNIHNTKHTNSKRFKYALQVSLIDLIQQFMVSSTKLMTGMASMTTILKWYL